LALWKNIGSPPTPLNARTGEFTPPGIRALALASNSAFVVMFFPVFVYVLKIDYRMTILPVPARTEAWQTTRSQLSGKY